MNYKRHLIDAKIIIYGIAIIIAIVGMFKYSFLIVGISVLYFYVFKVLFTCIERIAEEVANDNKTK